MLPSQIIRIFTPLIPKVFLTFPLRLFSVQSHPLFQYELIYIYIFLALCYLKWGPAETYLEPS